jgi:PQQ-dependent catabolism-associated CXXCW motif protein
MLNLHLVKGGVILFLVFLMGCSAPTQVIKEEELYRGLPYHAPTTQIPPLGVQRVSAESVKLLLQSKNSLFLIDVYGAIFREESLDFDGAWLVSAPRENIPGSIWLPNVGKQELKSVVEQYFHAQLIELSGNSKDTALVFYCIEDCWMAWNAAKRAHEWGYSNVMWFREGVDGWKDKGWPLQNSEPVNLPVND